MTIAPERLSASCPELAGATAVRVLREWGSPPHVQRLEVAFGDGTPSRVVVVKGPPGSPGRRAFKESLGLPAVEARAYRLDPARMPGRPRLLGDLDTDPPSPSRYLVLEDVQEAAFAASPDPAAVAGLVRTLARFHAAWWGTWPDRWRWLPSVADPRRLDLLAARLGDLAQPMRASGWVPPEFVDGFPALAAALRPAAALLARGPATLLHGDLHPGNVFRDGTGRLRVLDWEAASLGRGVVDLVFFALPCADPEQPARSLHDALRWYADELARLGVADPPGPDSAELWAAVLYYALRRFALRADPAGVPGDTGLVSAVRFLANTPGGLR
jgi:Phosphotransferase enzyme family